MKIALRHGARLLEIEVKESGGAKRVVVDGREHVVQARYADDETLVLEIDGRSETVRLARARRERFVAVHGESYHLVPETPGSAHADMGALADPHVRAPMPGKVLQVLVAAGDRVDVADGLLILEAMKMENRLLAPAAGVVESVSVAAGDMVSGGQLLVVLKFE